jgi:uncharacterized protein YjiS (DUF1127 family)
MARALADIGGMTTVQIELPDDLARAAAAEGLLSRDGLEALLRAEVRRRAGAQLTEMMDKIAASDHGLTPEDVEAEIAAVRAERRARAAR